MNYNHLDNKELINYVTQNTTLELELAKRLESVTEEFEDFKDKLEILNKELLDEEISDDVEKIIFKISTLIDTS